MCKDCDKAGRGKPRTERQLMSLRKATTPVLRFIAARRAGH